MATEPTSLKSHRKRMDARLKARKGIAPVTALDSPRAAELQDSQALAELAIMRRTFAKSSAVHPPYELLRGFLMGLADLIGLAAASSLGIFTAAHFHSSTARIPIVNIGGFVAMFLVVYLASGLYPGTVVHPVDELRKLSVGTTLSSIVVLMVGAAGGHSILPLRMAPFVWGAALLAVPLCRLLVRRLFARRHWWGVPAIILGAGKTGHYISSLLTRHPDLGLKPVGFLDDRRDRYDEGFASLPYLGPLRHAGLAAQAYGAQYAIVAMPHISSEDLASIIRRHARVIPHLLVIPDLLGTADLAVQPRNLGGVLGLEINQNLAQRFPQFLKRCVDIVLAAFSLMILSPLFFLLYLAVRFETPGPAFYPQDRIGRDGKTFKIWKIRSMRCDGDQVLHRACRENPALAAEWKQYHKLREDPRVTGIGRRLRRLSLDELPQLWNVLRGDMSLVGPRPIVRAEVDRYEDRFDSYTLVRPGITGLWQVSGRNNTSYDERVGFDDYYVRNWSVWLDFYILARTLRTVLTCEGAY